MSTAQAAETAGHGQQAAAGVHRAPGIQQGAAEADGIQQCQVHQRLRDIWSAVCEEPRELPPRLEHAQAQQRAQGEQRGEGRHGRRYDIDENCSEVFRAVSHIFLPHIGTHWTSARVPLSTMRE